MDAQGLDGVVSFHLNKHTCGVARFNVRLSEALSLPCVGFDDVAVRLHFPLVSIKVGEIDDHGLSWLNDQLPERFGLLLHDFLDTECERDLISRAEFVVALNSEMQRSVAKLRPDCQLGFAPGLAPAPRHERTDVTLLTFGMAHKIDPIRYGLVGRMARSDRRTFFLEVSSALHEGTRFDDRFFSVLDDISAAFGEHVRFLGFLSDDEVTQRLHTADALLAFFPKGVRENNTSVIGAMAHGVAVITNVDDQSPDWCRHGETVFDLDRLTSIPSLAELRRVGSAARAAVAPLTFGVLGERIVNLATAERSISAQGGPV
jgi:hypothetical protein